MRPALTTGSRIRVSDIELRPGQTVRPTTARVSGLTTTQGNGRNTVTIADRAEGPVGVTTRVASGQTIADVTQVRTGTTISGSQRGVATPRIATPAEDFTSRPLTPRSRITGTTLLAPTVDMDTLQAIKGELKPNSALAKHLSNLKGLREKLGKLQRDESPDRVELARIRKDIANTEYQIAVELQRLRSKRK
jgi:hypothetical protein